MYINEWRDLRIEWDEAKASAQYDARWKEMRKEYNFSKAKRSPYAKRLKQSVTMRLDSTTINYFKGLSNELDVPYQTLINLYLRDCANTGRRPAMNWRPSGRGAA